MRRILEKLRGSKETEFGSDNYIDLSDSENEGLRWSNRDDLYEVAESVPESIVDYGVERFVQEGEFSLEHFAEALDEANEVWETYRERDEHNPRPISESDANLYGAGGAGPGFATNAPIYSEETRSEAKDVIDATSNRLEGLYNGFDAKRMMDSLLGPEEIAQAELLLRNETDVYED